VLIDVRSSHSLALGDGEGVEGGVTAGDELGDEAGGRVAIGDGDGVTGGVNDGVGLGDEAGGRVAIDDGDGVVGATNTGIVGQYSAPCSRVNEFVVVPVNTLFTSTRKSSDGRSPEKTQLVS
jgi:hypothetical protein